MYSNHPKILSGKIQTPVIITLRPGKHTHRANLLNWYNQYLKLVIHETNKRVFQIQNKLAFSDPRSSSTLKVLRPTLGRQPSESGPQACLCCCQVFHLHLSPSIFKSLPLTKALSFLSLVVIKQILKSSKEANLKHYPSSQRLTCVRETLHHTAYHPTPAGTP